jgi:hypothetical protein
MLLRRVIEHVRAQNWTAVGIDFAIVVVGILLALQISDWNLARQDRVRERAYLARIAAELEQSFHDIEYSIEIAQEREALGRMLIDSVNNEEPVRADPGRYLLALLKGGFTYAPEIRMHSTSSGRAATSGSSRTRRCWSRSRSSTPRSAKRPSGVTSARRGRRST